jgi:hypothetical protein
MIMMPPLTLTIASKLWFVDFRDKLTIFNEKIYSNFVAKLNNRLSEPFYTLNLKDSTISLILFFSHQPSPKVL